MRCPELLLTAALACLAGVTALAQGPTFGLGRTPSGEEVRAADTAAAPDGTGLPPGKGTAKEGVVVYSQKCVACHGANGTGTALHRGLVPLGNTKPVKIEGSLVPYATTVWDFINRAMPWTTPGSLTTDEAYAVTAYVLFLNDIVKESDILDAKSLPKVRMPHRDDFIPAQPEWTPGERRRFGNYP